MFRDAIVGMDKLLETDIVSPSVILVKGSEGTVKSGLVFSLMSNELESIGTHGLYASLEQTKESHINNMDSLGIPKNSNLHIFDYRDIRIEWDESNLDMIKITEEIIDYYIDKYADLSIFALDSLNALYALSATSNLRRNMYHFFTNLREKGLISFLILESSQIQSAQRSPENFLSDGVIELGMLEGNEGVKRYIQIKKMRSTRHRMEKHQLMIQDDGLKILGQIY